jgi:ATP synthase protein I
MSDREKSSHNQPPANRLGDEIGRSAQRKQRARARNKESAWFGLGMFGLVGWSVAIPMLAGIMLGLWLDEHWPGRHSWTLTLLIIGIALGCLNAWYWIKQESTDDQ